MSTYWIYYFVVFCTSSVVGTPVLGSVHKHATLFVEAGNDAEPFEFPWQVSLRSALEELHFCGGVIIDRLTVLTTASCAELASPYLTTVIAGNLQLNTRDDSGSQQRVQVTSVHIHPDYAQNSDFSNDIAVLKVNTEFLMTEYVSSVPALHMKSLVLQEYAVIAGWGTKHEEEISLSEKLQKSYVTLIGSNANCQRILDEHNSYNQTVVVEDSMICIISPASSNPTTDSCMGDQGGSLMIYENGSPVLLGLISFGIGCGRNNLPSFCTRISPYVEFIKQYQESNLNLPENSAK